MSPRKKSKPNPQAPAAATAEDSQAGTDGSTEASTCNAPSQASASISSNKPAAGFPTPSPEKGQTLNKKASRKWLGGGGSWRSKAPADVQTARHSIGVEVAGGAASELPDEDVVKDREQSPAKFLSKRKSSKGEAIPTSTTRLNVSSDGSLNEPEEAKPAHPDEPNTQDPPLPPEPPKAEQSAFGWRSWWSRPDGYSDPTKAREAEDASSTPLPRPTPSEEVDAKSKELGNTEQPAAPAVEHDIEMKDAHQIDDIQEDMETKDAPATTTAPEGDKSAPSTSWFWLWSSAQNARTNTASAEPPAAQGNATKPALTTEPTPEPAPEPPSAEPTPAPQVIEAPPPDQDGGGGSDTLKSAQRPSGWAFWFRESPKTDDKADEGTPQKQVGEIAVSDTPSQSHPEAAQFNEQEPSREEPPKEPVKPVPEPKESIAKRSFRSLRGRPKSTSTLDTPSSTKVATPLESAPPQLPVRAGTLPVAPAAQPALKLQTKTKQEPPNLILPEFKSTYRLVQQPSFWQQIRQYFLGGEPPMPHLHINPAPLRIKKAVAIGVHGFFPAPIIQKVLGQPTGTSIRFATAARKAIEDWTQARGYSPEIEQIALEGEGFIAERVNTLWKLLLNWIDHIKSADFILVACHSQGVPVAMMLVAKLIQFGCVNSARIAVCAMAGINQGPFIEYKTRYLGGTASELFEFSNPKSLVSQMYLAALDEALKYGVRILYVGSIDDQLVSLESSTFSTLSHPYIYRAVFVDGRIHAPDFLTHLVGFTLKLRNLGLPDHGLIRELSPALAGSLYGGEGHSRVYEDPRIYELAVQHALETTSLPVLPQQQKERPSTAGSFKGINIPVVGAKGDEKDVYKLRVKEYESVGGGNQNPFFLPWAMRGLLEEEFVKRELSQEVEELLAMFEDWKPTSKQLKDVKFRLEGVRSKL